MSAQQNTPAKPEQSERSNVQQLVDKIVELQDKLVESQEKNLALSTLLREMEMRARDGEDLKGELSNQSALISDKSRENKRLHQDLAKVTALFEEKLKELEEVNAKFADLQGQLRQREMERDLLAEMLTEKEKQIERLRQPNNSGTFDAAARDKDREKEKLGWLNPFKGKSP